MALTDSMWIEAKGHIEQRLAELEAKMEEMYKAMTAPPAPLPTEPYVQPSEEVYKPEDVAKAENSA